MTLLDKTLTKDQKGALLVESFNQMAKVDYNQLVNHIHVTLQNVWKNADGLTPQEVFDLLGKEAVTYVKLLQLALEFVSTVNPAETFPDVVGNFTINVDGTVTVDEVVDNT